MLHFCLHAGLMRDIINWFTISTDDVTTVPDGTAYAEIAERFERSRRIDV